MLSQLSTIPAAVFEDTLSPSIKSLSLRLMSKIGKCFSGITLPPELNGSKSPTNSPLFESSNPSKL